MATQHQDDMAPSAAESLGPTSIGNLNVTLALLARFLEDTVNIIGKAQRKELDDSGYRDQYLALVKRTAAIFDGQDPAYVSVQGWSGGPLRDQLRSMLPVEWMNQERRTNFDDNPIGMYLDLLVGIYLSALNEAKGDNNVAIAKLRPTLEQAVKIMAGKLS